MKPPVALFKTKIMKFLFLKTKSQVKAYQRSCILFASVERLKKNVKKKLGESVLELICFIFISFMDITSLRLFVCIICSLFFTYAFIEAEVEKCLLNIGQEFFEVGTTSKVKKFHYAH